MSAKIFKVKHLQIKARIPIKALCLKVHSENNYNTYPILNVQKFNIISVVNNNKNA